MELSWLMRLRIAAAAATGVVLIGILAWPLAAPPDPFEPVSLITSTISFGDAIILMAIALLAGFIAYFLSWPYGREIGILAAPAGLALWAVRSGSMAGLMQQYTSAAQRQILFGILKWEPFFWLAIVAAGFGGVLIGQKIRQKPMPAEAETQKKANSKPNIYLSSAIALIGSVLIAQFLISILAQDVRIYDSKLGSLVGQPAVGQIAFAVLVSFGAAAFVVKKFLNTGYNWPIIASALVTGFAISTYIKQDVLEYLSARYPAVFFSSSVIAVLPVQMVAFGTLGSIAGYWLAVRFDYWRKHEL
jgi:hypothetical protein